MNKRAYIAAAIKSNRIALLRIVYCWLTAAQCLNMRGDRRLPPRLARFVLALISKAEKATGFLLIAVFYHGQSIKQKNLPFERAAMGLVASNSAITLGALTVAGCIKRLKALQLILLELHQVARRLAKSIVAYAHIEAIKADAMNVGPLKPLPLQYRAHAPDNVLPP